MNAPEPRLHTLSRYWLALQSLLLAVLVTWPVAGDPGAAAIGSPEGDVYKHLWTLWWMRREALSGVPGLRTALVAFPDGMALWPIEPVNGLLSLILPFPVVVLSNLLALFHVTLLGLTAGWLGALVARRREGGWISGALAQCSAVTAFTLQVGVGELRQLWWVPLGLACLVKASDSGQWRWFAALGASLVGATLACWYHGCFLAIATLVYALATLRLRLLPRYVVTAVLATSAVVGPIHTFGGTFNPGEDHSDVTFQRWMDDAHKSPLDTYPDASADLYDLFVTRAVRARPTDEHLLAYDGGHYLGLGVLLLALGGLVADPRRAAPWLPVAAVGVLFAAGTVAWWDGEILTAGGGRMVLPLAWLNRAMGYWVDPINFPSRFLVIPMVALSAMAAPCARWRPTSLLVVLACADLLTGDIVPWPRTRATLADMRGLEGTGTGAVADVTAFMELAGARVRNPDADPLDVKGPVARRRAIAAQIALDRAFDSIPIERMDRWSPEGFMWLEALPLCRALAVRPWVPPTDATMYRPSLWLLRDRGFDSLLLTHATQGVNPDAEHFLTAILGKPVVTAGATLWTIPTVEATEEEQATWRSEQAARLKDVPRPALNRGIAGGAH